MNIKPDDKLAMVVNSCNYEANGSVVEIRGPGVPFFGIYMWAHTPDKTGRTESSDRCLRPIRPIRDNPGNESWFKAAPIEHTTPKKVAA